MTRAEIVAEVARALYGDADDDTWAILLKEWRRNPAIWDRVQDAFDAAGKVVSLCFARAAEMCDEMRPQFEADDSLAVRDDKANAWGWLTVAAERLRALAHPPATTQATHPSATATPQSQPASAARLSADDTEG